MPLVFLGDLVEDGLVRGFRSSSGRLDRSLAGECICFATAVPTLEAAARRGRAGEDMKIPARKGVEQTRRRCVRVGANVVAALYLSAV